MHGWVGAEEEGELPKPLVGGAGCTAECGQHAGGGRALPPCSGLPRQPLACIHGCLHAPCTPPFPTLQMVPNPLACIHAWLRAPLPAPFSHLADGHDLNAEGELVVVGGGVDVMAHELLVMPEADGHHAL